MKFLTYQIQEFNHVVVVQNSQYILTKSQLSISTAIFSLICAVTASKFFHILCFLPFSYTTLFISDLDNLKIFPAVILQVQEFSCYYPESKWRYRTPFYVRMDKHDTVTDCIHSFTHLLIYLLRMKQRFHPNGVLLVHFVY